MPSLLQRIVGRITKSVKKTRRDDKELVSIVGQPKNTLEKDNANFPAVYKATQEKASRERQAERERRWVAETKKNGFPAAYKALPKKAANERADIFEPALRQYMKAFRKGEPVFASVEERTQWEAARLRVMDHLLQIIGASPWRDALILRGSLLLFAYLGDDARRPGDMDFVFMLSLDGQTSTSVPPDALLNTLVRDVMNNRACGNVHILANEITADEIWTYERAEGRRIVFPWETEGLPAGEVQIDIVFNEPFFEPPVQVILPSPFGNGAGRTVLAASEPLSLAWKLLWLETDRYPQGKDLYDATLLAEKIKTTGTFLPCALLYRVLDSSKEMDASGKVYYSPASALVPNFPLKWDVDWENFQKEYPYVDGSAKEWQARLNTALASTFADVSV